mmetsp:Transcript_13670/g.36966  ORF Transcript_13670/g.36966 Transcript_13670/m.36966 type:complete len:83 (+) Transcript_13670:423-671(+)
MQAPRNQGCKCWNKQPPRACQGLVNCLLKDALYWVLVISCQPLWAPFTPRSHPSDTLTSVSRGYSCSTSKPLLKMIRTGPLT